MVDNHSQRAYRAKELRAGREKTLFPGQSHTDLGRSHLSALPIGKKFQKEKSKNQGLRGHDHWDIGVDILIGNCCLSDKYAGKIRKNIIGGGRAKRGAVVSRSCPSRGAAQIAGKQTVRTE